MKTWKGIGMVVLVTCVVMGLCILIDRWRATDATIATLHAEIAELNKGLAANSAEVKRLSAAEEADKEDAREWREALLNRIEHIQVVVPQQAQAMPMTEAVSETRRLIKDDGVSQVESGVMFTTTAFRFNLAKLMEGEQFSLALGESMGESKSLAAALAAADAKVAVHEDSLFKKDEHIKKLNIELGLAKKADTMKVIKGAGVGVAAGIILTLLLNR